MRDARAWALLVVGVAATTAFLAGSRAAEGAEESPGRVRCQSFARGKDEVVDTRDGGTDLGRWVMEQEDGGWRVHTVENDVAVRASGQLETWTHVCVVPIH